MSGREEDVLHWITGAQGELVGILQMLVRVPSVTGEEGPCQEVVARLMAEACDSVDVWEPDRASLEQHPAYTGGPPFNGRPNVVGILRGSGGGRSLLLNAHVDVVEPGPPAAWQHGPWSGAIDRGRIFGRGAVDDKAGLAAAIFLACCFHSLGIRPKGNIIIESVVEEEWSGAGTIAAMLRGYKADAGILLEPNDLAISPASRGGQAFRVTVTGKGAHPVRCYEGVSALDKAIPILRGLKRLQRDRQRRITSELFHNFPVWLPVIVGKISADESQSKVPEKCVLDGLMGYAPEEDYRSARRELEAAVATVAARDPWLSAHPPLVQWPGLNKEGTQIAADHPLVQTMSGAAAMVGCKPRVVGFAAGCDLPLLTRYGETPSVLFGPGDGMVAHGSNEYVDIDQVVSAVHILALTAVRWCGV